MSSITSSKSSSKLPRRSLTTPIPRKPRIQVRMMIRTISLTHKKNTKILKPLTKTRMAKKTSLTQTGQKKTMNPIRKRMMKIKKNKIKMKPKKRLNP